MTTTPTQRVVFVTGCSTGIGRATAERLASNGFQVVAGVRRQEDAAALEQAVSGITTVICDVTDADSIAAAIAEVERCYPDGIHGLVNNAGIAVAGPLELVPVDQWQRQFEVNVMGIVRMTQASLPLLRRCGGRIVNISSAASKLALPMVGAYASSKYAVEGLSDSLRRELSPFGVSVIVVIPGQTATPIFDKTAHLAETQLNQVDDDRGYGQTLARIQDLMHRSAGSRRSPDRVAKAVVNALTARRPRRRYYVGWDARGALLVHQFVPDALVDWVIARRIN